MKVQQEINSNIEYIGEIKENKVGIDRENIDFIATLLTSNLYSNPFESFLRETISNAYDSHIEANTDHPIILMIDFKGHYGFNYSKEPYNISVRDYGVGISPERFQQIYTNIGSSTKRESNDYIGGWGIGRFAALSCSDNVQINSYYNGVKYSYIMYKNGTGINIDKISETPGNYSQGVEICINNIELDVDTIKTAINKLIFFDNLVIHGNNIQTNHLKVCIDHFNQRNIEKFKNFASSDYEHIDNSVYAKVGNVLYNIDKTVIQHRLFDSYYNFIAIECPIGSVNVTPNREQLQYTDKTIKKLKEVLDKAAEEMSGIAEKHALQDFKSINAAYNFYAASNRFKISSRISYNIPQLIKFHDLIVNGQKIPWYVWDAIESVKYDDIPEQFIDNILNKPNRRVIRTNIRIERLFTYNLALKCDDRLKQVTKEYYCDNHNDITLVIKNSDVKNLLITIIEKVKRRSSLEKTKILRAMSFILKNYDYHKLQNDKVPQTFIDNFKQVTKKSNTTKRVEVRRYVTHEGYRIYGLQEYLNWHIYAYPSKKKLRPSVNMVVYSANTKSDDLLRCLSSAFRHQKIEFITTKKENLEYIPKSRIFISLENFLTLYQKIIAKCATAVYLRRNYGQYYDSMNYTTYGKTKSNLKSEFNQYLDKYYVYSTSSDINILMQQYIDKNWLDWAAIIKYQLSDDDKKRIAQRNTLSTLEDVADSLLYIIKGRYSKDNMFGIKPNKKTILLLTKLLRK